MEVDGMPRGRTTFRQRDVTKALRGAKAAGVEIKRVEIDPGSGKIVVTAAGGETESHGESETHPKRDIKL
jgi:hypothetical protein